MQIINQYSLLISGVIAFLIIAFFLLRHGIDRNSALSLVVIGVIMTAGWYLVRPTQSVENSAYQVQAQIGSGRPVLLELQSPY